MLRIDTGIFARGSGALLASALVVLGAGCAGEVYAGPSGAEGPPVVAGSAGSDGVVYVQAPPAEDMGSYPSVVYGGVNVYYVGGRWYERGPRGWAYYRQEPPALGRQREEHFGRDHDPRWSNQPGAANRGQAQRGPAPAPHTGVTEAQGTEHRAPSAQPRGGQTPAQVAPTARPGRKKAEATPTPKKVAPSDKRAPVRSSAPTEEERR
jgi:hypothetical protein